MDAHDSVPERRLRRPSGDPPPGWMTLPGGAPYELAPLAGEVTERLLAAHPGLVADGADPEVVRAWCEHDNRHLLSWAAASARGLTDLIEQVSWLARVLEARGHAPARLADDLAIAADVVDAQVGPAGAEVAAQLRAAAEHVAATPTFLD